MVVDQRLSAVFQYPNTTATYLFCGWLAALSLVLESAQLQEKRETVFYGTVAFFCFYAFILTISRGAFLVAGMLILVLLVLTPDRSCLIFYRYFSLLLLPQEF